MEYRIRKAELSDAGEMASLRIAMRRERETAPPPADSAAFAASMEAYFRNALSGDAFLSYVAVTPEGAIAAMSGMVIETHPPTHTLTDGRFGYIVNMYTAPAHRKQGLAEKMLHALLDEVRRTGLKRVLLNASPMGRSLYLKNGFRELPGEMVLDL